MIIYLPKLSFNLTESQKKLISKIQEGKFDNLTDLGEKVGTSPAMLYRNINELKDMDLIMTEEGIKLTDAGRIAVL